MKRTRWKYNNDSQLLNIFIYNQFIGGVHRSDQLRQYYLRLSDILVFRCDSFIFNKGYQCTKLNDLNIHSKGTFRIM